MRRVVLIGSCAVWLGMIAALGLRERARRRDRQNAYIEALFGRNAPVLVSRSVYLREELTGTEKHLGFMDMQVTQFAGRDVHVRHTLNISAEKMPAVAKGVVKQLLAQMTGEDVRLRDFEGRLDVYINRRLGLKSVKGRAKYGRDKFDFDGKPLHGKYLRITSRWGGQQSTNLINYDPRVPFGTGGSPFLSMRNLEEGASWKVSFFDPFSRRMAARVIQVVGREKIKYRRKDTDCWVLTSHPMALETGSGSAASFGTKTAKAWVSVKDGKVLREEAHMMIFTLIMVLEDSVTAEERDYRKRMKAPDEIRGRKVPAAAKPAGKKRTAGDRDK